MKRLSIACSWLILFSVVDVCFADILFESGTLGPTGVPWQDVYDQLVFGENVSGDAINGVRFEIIQRAITAQVGGHFVRPPNSDTTLFAAIIELDSANDFPDSVDLSTPDVLGTTLLTVPDASDVVAGNLGLELRVYPNTGIVINRDFIVGWCFSPSHRRTPPCGSKLRLARPILRT